MMSHYWSNIKDMSGVFDMGISEVIQASSSETPKMS